MSIRVKIPTQLRPLAGGNAEISIEGVTTLQDVMKRIQSDHPELITRIIDAEGQIQRFINVFVGDEDVRFLQGLETPVEGGQTVSILPAVAGGSGGYRPEGLLELVGRGRVEPASFNLSSAVDYKNEWSRTNGVLFR